MASYRTNSRRARSTTHQYAIRICLLGEVGAGKSSLYHRIKYKSFRDASEDGQTLTSSIGGTSRNRSYESHTLVIKPDQKTKINLTIVDTASRERYQSLTAQYYRRANAILMVCSLDSEYTLTRLAKWYQDAQYYVDNSEIIFGLVGTKSDISETRREVTSEMLRQFGTHYTISPTCVFEVSSKTGEGVDVMLNTMCEAVIEQFKEDRPLNVEQPVMSERSSLIEYSSMDRTGETVVPELNSVNSVRINTPNLPEQNSCISCCHCCCTKNRKCVLL